MAGRKRQFNWWRSFRRRYNALIIVTLLLMVFGIILLLLGLIFPSGQNVAWLIGGALLAAGFSALVATATGSQAIHEQYAKEANLYRKREIYEPLFSELRSLRERLEEAHQGISPFPQAIALLGDDQSQAVSQGGYLIPRLEAWPQIQRDYRRDSFAPATQKELVELHRLAIDYTTSLEALRKPTNDILMKRLNQAQDILVQSDAYQAWFKANSDNGNYRLGGPRHGDPAHQWFGSIAQYHSIGPDRFGIAYAEIWLRNGDHYSTATLGWLLSKNLDQAAAGVNEGVRGSARHFDTAWLEAIFQASWAELQHHPAYLAAWKVEEHLWTDLRKIEARLDDALRQIRDLYEGGEPFV